MPAFRGLRGLYAILDVGPGDVAGPAALTSVIERGEAALGGGAVLLQLRLKGLDDRAALEAASRLTAALRGRAPILVNDRTDLARAAGADGAHVGMTDLPPGHARQLLGARAVLGASAHTPDELASQLRGGHLDYVAYGPVFVSRTKQGHADPVGVAGVAHAVARADRPVCAIGGLDTPERVAEVAAAGASLVATISALARAEDPEAAARSLARAFEEGAARARGSPG